MPSRRRIMLSTALLALLLLLFTTGGCERDEELLQPGGSSATKAEMLAYFGPMTFTVQEGGADANDYLVAIPDDLLAEFEQPLTFTVINGDPVTAAYDLGLPDKPDGAGAKMVDHNPYDRVSMAIIKVGGEKLVHPEDLDEQVEMVQRPIVIEGATQMLVRIRGDVGTHLTVLIEGETGGYVDYLSPPVPSMSTLLVGMQETIRFTIAIAPNENLDTESVALWRVSDAEAREQFIGRMYDDGNLAHGDEILGDGVYSLLTPVAGTEPAALRYQVYAATMEDIGLVESASSVATINVVEMIPAEIADGAVAAQEAGMVQYEVFVGQVGEAEAAPATVDWLETQPNVAMAEMTVDGNIWVTYDSGLTGMLMFYDDGALGGAEADPARVDNDVPDAFQTRGINAGGMGLTAEGDEDVIQSNRILFYAPCNTEFGNNTFDEQIATQLENADCPNYDVTFLRDAAATVDAWNGLAEYGMVVYLSHGGINGEGEVMFISGEDYSLFSNHLVSWILHRISPVTLENGDTVWAIRPGLISSRDGTMPNSVIYAASCHGAENHTMADAFLGKGAGAFLGFDDTVYVPFANAMGLATLVPILLDGDTTQEAFVPGQTDPTNPAEAEAEFVMIPGTADVHFESGLLNGGFEEGNLAAWTAVGDGRVISQLADQSPIAGTYMGIISTGLGYTTSSGSIEQTFCLPADAQTLTMRWNFLSEEFLEWVGSVYQDYFIVDLTPAGGSTVTLLHETVDSFAANYALQSVSPTIVFDQGGVYMTGWLTLTHDVSALAGQTVTLRIRVGDVGDSIYDSAALLDVITVQ